MIYLQEEIARHRKFVIAGALLPNRGGLLAALGLYVAAIGYAREHFTDGFIDDEYLDTFPTESRAKDVAKALSSRRVLLWHRVRGGYQIHDFTDHNQPAEKLKHKRELARDRKRRQRSKQPSHQPTMIQKVTPDVTRDTECDPVRTRGTTVPRTHSVTDRASCTNKLSTTVLPTCTDRGTKNAAAPLTSPRVVAFRRQQSKATDTGKPKFTVIRALARDVIAQHSTIEDDGDLEAIVMRRCARDANLLYDSATVKRAVEQARAQLRRLA